jgi:hypothetical protein
LGEVGDIVEKSYGLICDAALRFVTVTDVHSEGPCRHREFPSRLRLQSRNKEIEGREPIKADLAPENGKGPLVHPLRDETTGGEGIGTLTSASKGRGRREEVEDVVEEFEGEFVEHRGGLSGCEESFVSVA